MTTALHNNWLEGWWHREIDEIISVQDPILCNLRITQAHYRLSQLLHDVTGEDSGANFHTWAVWGSKKAGETVRQEDTRRVRTALHIFCGTCGLGLIAMGATSDVFARRIAGFSLGVALALAPPFLFDRTLRRTRREILEGNPTVLEDIGKVTASFVSVFNNEKDVDSETIERFIETLRPGKTEAGGQALLGRAFFHYYQARF